MTEIGIRDLCRNASELVRRVENGERVIVTVDSRPVAELGPVRGSRSWVSWEDVTDVFRRPGDTDWPVDRDRVDQRLVDP